MLHTFDFCQEVVRDNGNIGVFDEAGIKNIDDGIGNWGLIYYLPNGSFNVSIAEIPITASQLAEAGLDGLEEGNFFRLGDRL
ncbi:hypothetical protein NC998_29605 [Trichocoleus desertorum GB2-A4]|uniref:Uncharacterized protein n=1 Tax=Trichocoleus desertorum GB2-A4 TaxID=2933944 RepID=A0ABV0JIP2_9CYAN|nr:hypothetical protein [Trichocoleus sp. FACHB-46]